ncbi:MAG: hypothetical protein CMP48_16230 [Rickettsiales bacterium]|nr:hypothetical protein [Rickettsiales bacterium]
MKRSTSYDPPQSALSLFRWYCRDERLEELEGDLLEMHEYRIRKGYSATRLKRLFWWDVIKCFKAYSIKTTRNKMNTSLYQSYLKIGVRNAWLNKGPVAINILGLGLSVGFCITVYMIMAYNLEFDSFYQNTDDLYRVHSFRTDNTEDFRYEYAPVAMVNYMQNSFSDVEEVAHFQRKTFTSLYQNEFYEERTAIVSENFLKVFDIPLRYGSPETLTDPNTVYLTKRVAEKYFGEVYPVGETMTLYINEDQPTRVTVGGVFDHIPLNSSFFFDILINFSTLETARDISANDWKEERAGLYFKSSNPASVEKQLKDLLPIHNQNNEKWQLSNLEVIPFIDERLADQITDYSPTNMRLRPQVIIIFSMMAFLILLVAVFNVANTAIALVSKRLKEVGIRKTLGTYNREIFIQFLLEMLVVTFSALIIALLLGNVFAREFFGAFGFSFLISDISIFNFLPAVILFLVIITLMAGFIPAAYARKFETISILNKRYKLMGVGWVNRLLIVGQFAFSIAVLITGAAFASNTEYMESYDFGFNSKNLMVFHFSDPSKMNGFENRLSQFPEVSSIIQTKNHHDLSRATVLMKNDTGNVQVHAYEVDAGYLEFMDIQLYSGRDFRGGSEADIQESVIVNEQFVNRYLPPGDVLNTMVTLDGQKKRIIGISELVSSDVYSDALPKPEVYLMTQDSSFNRLLVRTSSSNEQVEAKFKALWVELFETPFGGDWQHQTSGFYAVRDSKNLKSMFLALAGLGCFLSLIGIFSLASINVVKKTKEISIRKILGATFAQINLAVNRSFTIILIVSLFVGSALGYFISEGILQSIYKYYHNLSIAGGLVIGLGIVVTAFIFILAATVRPIKANPSDGLRSE